MRFYLEAIAEIMTEAIANIFPRRNDYAPSRIDYAPRRIDFVTQRLTLNPRELLYKAAAHPVKAGIIFILVFFAVGSTIILLTQALFGRQAQAAVTYSVPTYPKSKHGPLKIDTSTNNFVPVTRNPRRLIDTSSPATVNGVGADVAWPMRGKVTTMFGASHRPYQTVHTGIDITSARSSGVMPVTTFKAGTVVATNRKGGFGNHVIVDHGGGLSSVYGHLADISVLVGQEVKPGDVLGHEGSTGVSTGTHLHFEIRVNGSPVNPYSYVPGTPT